MRSVRQIAERLSAYTAIAGIAIALTSEEFKTCRSDFLEDKSVSTHSAKLSEGIGLAGRVIGAAGISGLFCTLVVPVVWKRKADTKAVSNESECLEAGTPTYYKTPNAKL